MNFGCYHCGWYGSEATAHYHLIEKERRGGLISVPWREETTYSCPACNHEAKRINDGSILINNALIGKSYREITKEEQDERGLVY